MRNLWRSRKSQTKVADLKIKLVETNLNTVERRLKQMKDRIEELINEVKALKACERYKRSAGMSSLHGVKRPLSRAASMSDSVATEKDNEMIQCSRTRATSHVPPMRPPT